MAVQAVKAGLGVQSVAESDRLLGRVAPADQPQIKEGKIPPGGLSSILHAWPVLSLHRGQHPERGAQEDQEAEG